MLVALVAIIVDFFRTVCMCWGVWSLIGLLFTIPTWSWKIGITLYVAIKEVWVIYKCLEALDEELKGDDE